MGLLLVTVVLCAVTSFVPTGASTTRIPICRAPSPIACTFPYHSVCAWDENQLPRWFCKNWFTGSMHLPEKRRLTKQTEAPKKRGTSHANQSGWDAAMQIVLQAMNPSPSLQRPLDPSSVRKDVVNSKRQPGKWAACRPAPSPVSCYFPRQPLCKFDRRLNQDVWFCKNIITGTLTRPAVSKPRSKPIDVPKTKKEPQRPKKKTQKHSTRQDKTYRNQRRLNKGDSKNHNARSNIRDSTKTQKLARNTKQLQLASNPKTTSPIDPARNNTVEKRNLAGNRERPRNNKQNHSSSSSRGENRSPYYYLYGYGRGQLSDRKQTYPFLHIKPYHYYHYYNNVQPSYYSYVPAAQLISTYPGYNRNGYYIG